MICSFESVIDNPPTSSRLWQIRGLAVSFANRACACAVLCCVLKGNEFLEKFRCGDLTLIWWVNIKIKKYQYHHKDEHRAADAPACKLQGSAISFPASHYLLICRLCTLYTVQGAWVGIFEYNGCARL